MNNEECFAWFEAAMSGEVAGLESFLSRPGWDVDVRSARGRTALHEAAVEGRVAAVRLLAGAGASTEARDANDLTPLLGACNRGGPAAEAGALALIDAGADVNARRTADGLTPLGAACGPGAAHIPLLAALLDHGAAVDGPSGTDWPPLLHAAKNNNFEAIELLAMRGANLAWRFEGPDAYHERWRGRTVREIAELEGYPSAELLAELERRAS